MLAPVARSSSIPSSRHDLVEGLKRTGGGDKVAFERVYSSTSAKLFGIIIRILERRDLAEDALQDTYVRVWQRAADFDPAVASPMTWLIAIARNRALDEIKRKTTRSLDDCPEVLDLPSDDDPLANLQRNEQGRQLAACLDNLEPERRRIVLLAYYYGMTREEIALATGRPVATVKTWLRRSLVLLKGCLSQ